jgi:hypothetical protein
MISKILKFLPSQKNKPETAAPSGHAHDHEDDDDTTSPKGGCGGCGHHH